MGENVTQQMRKGTVELCVLLLLSRGESYGYEIVSRLRRLDGLEAGESTVYPILSRLKGAGYLRQERRPSHAGPPRTYYSLSTTGRRYLDAILGEWNTLVSSVRSMQDEEQGG